MNWFLNSMLDLKKKKKKKKKKTLHQGLLEPEMYGNLVYKFKTNVGRADFSDQFKNISYVTNVLDIK